MNWLYRTTRHISLGLLQLLVTIYECCRGAIILLFCFLLLSTLFLFLRPGYRDRADFAAYIKRTLYRAAYNDSLAGSSWPAPSVCSAMGTLKLLLRRTVISFQGHDDLMWVVVRRGIQCVDCVWRTTGRRMDRMLGWALM